MNQKTSYAAPALRETVDAGAYSTEDPLIEFTNNLTTDCSVTPTGDWLRQQAIAAIKRFNAKHEQQKENPKRIKDSDNQYTTTKKPLPESNQPRVYPFDRDY